MAKSKVSKATTQSTRNSQRIQKKRNAGQPSVTAHETRSINKAHNHDLPFRQPVAQKTKMPVKVDLRSRRSQKSKRARISTLQDAELEMPRGVDTPSRHDSGVYQADDEYSAHFQRRFSDLYGHGRLLAEEETDNELIPTPPSNLKRKSPFRTELPTPKRVRFSPEPGETRKIQQDTVELIPVHSSEQMRSDADVDTIQDIDSVLPLFGSPAQHMLSHISDRPEPLSLPAIGEMFTALQENTRHFADRWFGTAYNDFLELLSGDRTTQDFPLHDLQVSNPALYLTITNILDASTSHKGYLSFLTNPEPKRFLVYGILGEWFTQRIFKDTSFGLSEDIQKKMTEKVDIRYLHYDSFVRAKKRSTLLAEALRSADPVATRDTMEFAAEELSTELMTLITPLLPNLKEGGRKAVLLHQHLQSELIQLICDAVGLNLSRVLSGVDGTIINVAHRLEPGRTYDPAAPMLCINPGELQRERDAMTDSEAADTKPMVKMTCWGRVEAFVPNGMDLNEMDTRQQELMSQEIQNLINSDTVIDRKQFDMVYRNFCWDCADPTAFPELPVELRQPACAKRRKIETGIVNAKLQRSLQRKRAALNRESLSSPSSSDGSGSSNGSSDESDDITSIKSPILPQIGKDGIPKDPVRGCWVTVYNCITPHQVYCEYDMPSEANPPGLNVREWNSLKSLIQRARASRTDLPHIKREDFLIKVWNIYAAKNLWFEWTPVLFFAIYLIRGGFSDHFAELLDYIKDFVFSRFDLATDVVEAVAPAFAQSIARTWQSLGASVVADQFSAILGKIFGLLPIPTYVVTPLAESALESEEVKSALENVVTSIMENMATQQLMKSVPTFVVPVVTQAPLREAVWTWLRRL